jgi:hypothetical protein
MNPGASLRVLVSLIICTGGDYRGAQAAGGLSLLIILIVSSAGRSVKLIYPIDKGHLAPLRLLHFLALAIFVSRLTPPNWHGLMQP